MVCSLCKYWEKDAADSRERGVCRLNPPTPIVTIYGSPNNYGSWEVSSEIENRWTETHGEDFCSRFAESTK